MALAKTGTGMVKFELFTNSIHDEISFSHLKVMKHVKSSLKNFCAHIKLEMFNISSKITEI